MAAEFFEAGYIGARFAFTGKTWPGIWRVKEVADRLTMGIWPAAWSVAGGLPTGKEFNVSAQETSPQGLVFKPDGTKFYIIGGASDSIYQYSCSTPWDLGSASYDGISLSIASQESDPRGLYFKPDGTKFYFMGTAADRVWQYSCSTPWDLSTASYDVKSFAFGSQETSGRDLTFKPDGTKFYITGTTVNSVYQYSCSTAWDVSTGSYDSKSYRFDSNRNVPETDPHAFQFNLDGTKCYMSGTGSPTDDVFQFSCAVPWDVSTMSYDGIKFNTQITGSNSGIAFKDDGTSMYLSYVGSGVGFVKEHSLTLL